MSKTIQDLLEAIDSVVSWDKASWQEKKAMILAECSEDDKINLEEFIGWFE